MQFFHFMSSLLLSSHINLGNIYLCTDQILLSNSADSSKRKKKKNAHINYFSYYFFSEINQFFNAITIFDLMRQFTPKLHYSISKKKKKKKNQLISRLSF